MAIVQEGETIKLLIQPCIYVYEQFETCLDREELLIHTITTDEWKRLIQRLFNQQMGVYSLMKYWLEVISTKVIGLSIEIQAKVRIASQSEILRDFAKDRSMNPRISAIGPVTHHQFEEWIRDAAYKATIEGEYVITDKFYLRIAPQAIVFTWNYA